MAQLWWGPGPLDSWLCKSVEKLGLSNKTKRNKKKTPKPWLVRHIGLWNIVSSSAGENQYEMLGKKIQLSCKIRSLECIKGRGDKEETQKKRHIHSFHKNLILTGFWCREGQGPESVCCLLGSSGR